MLTALFFFATATMTVVFILEKHNSDDTVARQKADITRLREDKQRAEKELIQTKGDLSAARKESNQLRRELEAQGYCLLAIWEYFAAESESEADRAYDTMVGLCEDIEAKA